ncbi:zinc finger protein 572-like [Contarinia nasturtii]|uniref:zinc finger protein 572-like n=1 Tax=Contarinia nasturtii TaxID=265458 RepID=UPI0012D48251|nr:zinc finger protein 572-like [Contarinia nasturtii]
MMAANDDSIAVPILCMCRLCLNYSQDCSDLSDSSNLIIRNQIKKYLGLEINDDNSLPKTICQLCFDRIATFDKYCNEVTQNQQLLSKLKDSCNETQIITSSSNLIQLAPAIVSNANGTLIITLQTTTTPTPAHTNLTDNVIISKLIKEQCIESNETIDLGTTTTTLHLYDKVENEAIEQNYIISTEVDKCTTASTQIERELDNLNSNDITLAEIHGESDNDDQYNEDEHTIDDNDVANSVPDLQNENFKDFPTTFIEDGKLLYRGRDLLEMISKFYRLACDQCSDKPMFNSLSTLCEHYADVHQIKGYVVCCNTKFIKPRAMALHLARHFQPDAFKCRECNKILTCPKILQYHMQNHLPESQRPLACTQCPRRFSYSSALIAHAISHQPESERAAHVCDECGKMFASAGRLTTHVNSHIKQGQEELACHICAKKFACRSNLAYHLTTHQPKTQQVQCTKCEKWLKNKFCLRKHMVQHSSIRYNCSICDYSALNQQCYRNHMRVQHTDVKPFQCDICLKSFKLKNTLRNHQVQHTGVRRFVCPFCNRSFASSGNYYSHRKRMHPNELAAMKLKQEEEDRQLREQAAVN